MRRRYFQSRYLRHFRSGSVTSLPVAPPQILLCPDILLVSLWVLLTTVDGPPVPGLEYYHSMMNVGVSTVRHWGGGNRKPSLVPLGCRIFN